METGTESNGTLVGIDLDIAQSLVVVGRDDDVDRLDGTGEGLVQVLLGDLQLKQSAVDLVDDTDRLNTLSQSLAQDGLGLDTDTRDTVDDDQGTVGDTEGSRDLRREVNVTGRVDQVDQELVTVDLLGDILQVLLVCQAGVQGDGGRLDGNASFLLIRTGIGKTSLSCLCCRNDTGTLDERVGQGRLSMVDCPRPKKKRRQSQTKIGEGIETSPPATEIHTVGDNGHVPDVGRTVHKGPDLPIVSCCC